MDNFKVYCLDNSELSHYEAEAKGYREDIFVFLNQKYFNLYVYDPIRIVQDFESEYSYYGFFSIEPNLIMVKNVTAESIINTIRMLIKDTSFFGKIKPIESVPPNLSCLKSSI
jgi:hypothetical protein